MARGAAALLLVALLAGVALSQAQAPSRGDRFASSGQGAQRATDKCTFTYKAGAVLRASGASSRVEYSQHAKKQDYTYRLQSKVSAYGQGLVSPTGYYKLDVTGGQYTTFTWWWQFCGNLNFRTTLPAQRPVCGNNAFSMCPEACKDASTQMCGNGCAALMAQQYTSSANSYCWSVGEWSNGADVSLSLYNPADPTAGIIYTIKKGDSQGCSNGARRSLSVAVQCPASGALGQAVFPTTITDLGNCAYATTMVHPSACPFTGAGTGGWTWGNTFLCLFFTGFGAYFVGGAAFRYKQLDMRGVEVVPHLEFWRELPGLVSDGAMFCVSKATELASGVAGGGWTEGAGVSRYVSHAAAGFQTIN